MKPYRVIHTVLLCLTLLFPLRSAGNMWYDVYYDPETSALLAGTMAAQMAEEDKAADYLDSILKHYGKTNFAVSGIFLTKHLERKALHDAGILGVPGQENYYYQHIYRLVYERIIPEILRCGVLLVDHIDQTYYWVPQLYLICEDVESLCQQFSAVCSNGTLTFNFSFPHVAEEAMAIVGIKDLDKVDWQSLFDEISHFDLSAYGESLDSLGSGLKTDMDDLYQSGKALLNEGWHALDSLWVGRSKVGALFSGKPAEMKAKLDSLQEFYEGVTEKYDVRARFEEFMGTVDSSTVMTTFFQYRDADPMKLISDLSHDNDADKYYKERWTVVRLESGKDPEVVYEEWFDSYTMDEDAFQERMQKKMESYYEYDYDNPWDYLRIRYVLMQDQREEYVQTNDLHLEGVNQAVFTLACDDGGDAGKGAESFKVNPYHSPLDEMSKVYAMQTEVSEADSQDLERLQDGVDKWQKEYDALDEMYDELDGRIGELEVQYAMDVMEYEGENIADVIARLENERDKVVAPKRQRAADSLAVWQSVYDEAADDLAGDDDIFRIPHIMRFLQGIYNLRWLDEGHWEGFTWVRRCHMPSAGQDVVLKVELRKERDESYFLGIRFHRSIISLNYGLYYSGHRENVVEYLDLDPSKGEEENAAIVEEHRRSWQQQFPECSVQVETRRQPAVEDSIMDHKVHLLWASDRVKVARDINARLELIHGRLQVMERTLRLTRSLASRVQDEIRSIVTDPVDKAWCYGILTERLGRMRENIGASPRRRWDEDSGEGSQ